MYFIVTGEQILGMFLLISMNLKCLNYKYMQIDKEQKIDLVMFQQLFTCVDNLLCIYFLVKFLSCFSHLTLFYYGTGNSSHSQDSSLVSIFQSRIHYTPVPLTQIRDIAQRNDIPRDDNVIYLKYLQSRSMNAHFNYIRG